MNTLLHSEEEVNHLVMLASLGQPVRLTLQELWYYEHLYRHLTTEFYTRVNRYTRAHELGRSDAGTNSLIVATREDISIDIQCLTTPSDNHTNGRYFASRLYYDNILKCNILAIAFNKPGLEHYIRTLIPSLSTVEVEQEVEEFYSSMERHKWEHTRRTQKNDLAVR